MFGTGQKRATAKAAPVHSIATRLRGRTFAGGFEVSGAGYGFSYTPSKARLEGGKLQLSGIVSANRQRNGTHGPSKNAANVRATLLAAQGGIGTAPPRKKRPAEIMNPRSDLPVVESTGSLSFSGLLFFKVAPLSGRALAIPADLSGVQLNVRLAPVNDAERAIQAAFSTIVDALYGNQPDESAAVDAIGELNKLLAGG